LKIKAPDITATGVLAIAAIAAGGYIVWRGSKVVGDAFKWAGQKVDAAKTAVVETAKQTVEPLSSPGILPPIGTQVVQGGGVSQDQRDWQNLQLMLLNAGNMGA